MTIPEAIGAVLLFTTVSIMILCTIRGVHSVPIYQYMLLLFITIAAILILAYCFDPRPTIRFDLGEHFKLLDKIRSEGWTYAINNSEYSKLYVTLAYFYLIAQTGFYHLLPVFPMLTEFLVAVYIVYDLFHEKGKTEIDFSHITYTLYIWFCSYGFLLALSGVRCTWAVSIATLGLYRDCVKKKRDIVTILCYIIPFFIHYFAIIAPIIRIMFTVKYKKTTTLGMIAAVIFGPQLAVVIYQGVSWSYIRTIMALIVRYWSGFSVWRYIVYAPTFSKIVYLGYIYTIIFALYMIYRLGHMETVLNAKERLILNVGRATAYVAIIVLFNYLFIERYMYILAYVLLMIVPLYLKYTEKSLNDTLIRGMTVIVMFGMFFLHNLYMILVNATGVYFLAR